MLARKALSTIASENGRAVQPLGVVARVGLQKTIFVHEKRCLLLSGAPLDALTIVRHLAATVITAAPRIIAAAFAIGLVREKLARDLKPPGLNKRSLTRRICCEKNRPVGGLRHSDLPAAKTVTMIAWWPRG